MSFIASKVTEIEKRIFEAANIVILKHGVEAATMGQIADEAGITRTTLNYYFRSKNHLIKAVLDNLEDVILPAVSRLVNDDTLPVLKKIEAFADEYLNLISKYPMVPSFIISELNRNPGWFISIIKNKNLNFDKLRVQIDDEVAAGIINPFKIEDLFVNLIGLCVFPIVSAPMLIEFFFNNDEKEFSNYLMCRKNDVINIINCWLIPRN